MPLTEALYEKMDAVEYKNICSKPDVLSRAILLDTRAVLASGGLPEVIILETALAGGAIDFPEYFSGDLSSSYHKVLCSPEQADAIAEYLFEKEAESVSVSGHPTPETSKLVVLVNIWHELADYVSVSYTHLTLPTICSV